MVKMMLISNLNVLSNFFYRLYLQLVLLVFTTVTNMACLEFFGRVF
jgi:hypothetical protein